MCIDIMKNDCIAYFSSSMFQCRATAPLSFSIQIVAYSKLATLLTSKLFFLKCFFFYKKGFFFLRDWGVAVLCI